GEAADCGETYGVADLSADGYGRENAELQWCSRRSPPRSHARGVRESERHDSGGGEGRRKDPYRPCRQCDQRRTRISRTEQIFCRSGAKGSTTMGVRARKSRWAVRSERVAGAIRVSAERNQGLSGANSSLVPFQLFEATFFLHREEAAGRFGQRVFGSPEANWNGTSSPANRGSTAGRSSATPPAADPSREFPLRALPPLPGSGIILSET